MESPSPSQWPKRAFGIAVTIYLAAIALYYAARLILDVAPVLITVGLLTIGLYVSWLVHQRHRGGW